MKQEQDYINEMMNRNYECNDIDEDDLDEQLRDYEDEMFQEVLLYLNIFIYIYINLFIYIHYLFIFIIYSYYLFIYIHYLFIHIIYISIHINYLVT